MNINIIMDKRKPKTFHNIAKSAIKFSGIAGDGLNIIGDIATVTGSPEIGIPLIGAGKVISKGSNLLKKII